MLSCNWLGCLAWRYGVPVGTIMDVEMRLPKNFSTELPIANTAALVLDQDGECVIAHNPMIVPRGTKSGLGGRRVGCDMHQDLIGCPLPE